jgi:AraC-like DNA-binding protein
MLNSSDGDRVSVKEIARSHGFSLGRLAHLFKEQGGLPVRRYYLWRKILKAIQALEQVSTLTDAAHLAGFADFSLMNRTCKQMFGIKPLFYDLISVQSGDNHVMLIIDFTKPVDLHG